MVTETEDQTYCIQVLHLVHFTSVLTLFFLFQSIYDFSNVQKKIDKVFHENHIESGSFLFIAEFTKKVGSKWNFIPADSLFMQTFWWKYSKWSGRKYMNKMWNHWMDSIEMCKRLDGTFEILIVFSIAIHYCRIILFHSLKHWFHVERQNIIFCQRIHRSEILYTFSSMIGMHGQNWQQYKPVEGGKTRLKLCNGCRIMMVEEHTHTQYEM